MKDWIKVKALKPFSRFVDRHGIIHGDPLNREKAVQFPKVPPHLLPSLVEDGDVEELAAEAPKAPDKPTPPTGELTAAEKRAVGLAKARQAAAEKRAREKAEAEAAAAKATASTAPEATDTHTPDAGQSGETEGADDGAPAE